MKAENVKNIAIIGAGLIAPGTALVFAQTNFNVNLWARRAEALPEAIDRIKANLQAMVNKGLMDGKEISPIIQRIKPTTDLAEAVKGAQFVLESIAENMEIKQDMFQKLDRLCSPETIIGSNSSAMSISEIAAKSKNRGRMVGAHFWNPPHIIPLVEVVKGKETTDETMEIAYQVLKKAGKRPIKCLKDVPGFVANRLQHALWREAISIVENGIADAQTVDEAVKYSFGARIAAIGPLETADMVGLDLTLAIHNTVLPAIESRPGPSPLLLEKIKKGELGFKTGKGFYEKWTPEDIKASRERLTNFLLDNMKKQQGK